MSDIAVATNAGVGEPTLIADAATFDAEQRRAIDACLRVWADMLDGEERLHRTLEAGRRLRAVDRVPGKRTDRIKPLDEVMTRYEAVIDQAGVSAQAAHVWQKASEIHEAVVADYIAEMKKAGHDITVAGLLRWAPKPGGGGGGKAKDINDYDLPTHVCPHCGCLVLCDWSGK